VPQTHKTGICAGLSPRPAMRQAARRAVTAAVEQLEDRTLLSPITFTDGVLTLTGGSTRENHLYIDVSGSQYLVTANGSSLHVTPSALKKIIVNGGPLADRVWINTKVTAPAVVQTLGGNDRISTGNGNDSITAGTGNDIITGCGGNDTITAGDGNDTIYGGSGNDSITTGNGKNFVSGDDGNDTITTSSGSDRIIGGAGNEQGGAERQKCDDDEG